MEVYKKSLLAFLTDCCEPVSPQTSLELSCKGMFINATRNNEILKVVSTQFLQHLILTIYLEVPCRENRSSR